MGATHSNSLTSLYKIIKRNMLPDVILKYYEGERPFTPLHCIMGLSTLFRETQAWKISSGRISNKSYKPSKEGR